MFTQKVRHDRQSANRNVKKLGGTLWALKLEKKTVTIAEIDELIYRLSSAALIINYSLKQKGQMPKMKDLLLFSVSCHWKPNIFGYWTVGQTTKAI